MKRLLALGDSHSRFWQGENSLRATSNALRGVDVWHIGAHTAHKLFDQVMGKALAKAIAARLAESPEGYGALILHFGEIDCRVHLVAAALRQGVSLDEAVEATIANYLRFVDWLREAHAIPLVLWGPGPASPAHVTRLHAAYPLVGSALERNYVTWRFNQALEREAAARPDVAYAGIFEALVSVKGVTEEKALYDGFHVDSQAMRHALPALRAALLELGCAALLPNLERRWPIAPVARPGNVAQGMVPELIEPPAPAQRAKPLSGMPDGQACAVLRPGPRLLLDLRAAFLLRRVEIALLPGDPAALSVEVSADNVSFAPLHPEGGAAMPAAGGLLGFDLPAEAPLSRFLRLGLAAGGPRAIDTIRMIAPVFTTETAE